MQWRYSYLCQAIGAITTPLTLPPYKVVEEGEGAGNSGESSENQDEGSSQELASSSAAVLTKEDGQESKHDPAD